MLHVGMDLSRTRLDVCVMDETGTVVDESPWPHDADGLAHLVRTVARYGDHGVLTVIESMNGARFVHDTLELFGWQVELADAQKVKGLAPLACKTDRIARVLAELSRRDLVPLLAFGKPCPLADLFGTAGRELLSKLELPEPWAADVAAALSLIDTLDAQIRGIEADLRRLGADHP